MTEQSYEERVQLQSLSNIKAEGITIRVGNQIVKFVADETQDILVEDEVRNELQEKYNLAYTDLKRKHDELVQAVKQEAKRRTQELEKKEQELIRKERELVKLPIINENQARQGLTVSVREDGRGYIWSYICVYAPKYMNNKIIEPNFAKRLMTPIRIFIYTDRNWKVSDIKLVKLINCDKFTHYHSTGGGNDCWGEFRPSGTVVDTTDKALQLVKNVRQVLETINRMSIGTENPRGLPRLTTLESNLLTERPDPQNNTRDNSSATKRNERAGFDENVNEDVAGELWSADM